MSIRGIRGATTVLRDQADEILDATRELLEGMLAANPGLDTVDICSVFFTVSADLSATFPAEAAREMGWVAVPMLCGREIPVPGSMPFTIRVMIHWNTDTTQDTVRHVYLKATKLLRPDLAPHHEHENAKVK